MTVGKVYTITLGVYTAKYLCTRVDPLGWELRRVRLGKTKIDSIRLPSTIFINNFAQ